jgi:hypothetical protein
MLTSYKLDNSILLEASQQDLLSSSKSNLWQDDDGVANRHPASDAIMERKGSLTLPQNRPSFEGEDLPASTAVSTTRDGEGVKIEVSPATDGTADEKKDEAPTTNGHSKDNQVLDVTSNEGTPSPMKDAASIKTADSRPQYKHSRAEEKQALLFINRSHAFNDADTASTFKSDQEILKLTEMVSQMTHLLAASGMVSSSRDCVMWSWLLQGKQTTARALAYINGPDKLDAMGAMIEAKRDRKKFKKRPVTAAQSASSKSGSTATNKKPNNSNDESAQNDAPDNADPGTAIVSTSDENGDAVMTQASVHPGQGRINGEGDAKATEAQIDGNAGKPKKIFRRPKWNWGSRRRNEKKNKVDEAEKVEDKAEKIQEPATDGAASAMDHADAVDEQKDRSDIATFEVARTAWL